MTTLFQRCCSVFTSDSYRQAFIHQIQDRPTSDLLKWFLWYWHQELLNESFQQCFTKTYQLMFVQFPQFKRIDQRYTLIYQPKKNMSRYSFCWGCDLHYYGWNIIGNVIEQCLYSTQEQKIEPVYISILYELCENLEKLFQTSSFPLRYMSVVDMMTYFSISSLMDSMDHSRRWTEFEQKQSKYQKEMECELRYPNSLFGIMYQNNCTEKKRILDKEFLYHSYIRPLCEQKKLQQPLMYQIPEDIWMDLEDYVYSKRQKNHIPASFLPYLGIDNQSTHQLVLYFDETTECWSPFHPCEIEYEQRVFSCPFDLFTYLIQTQYHLPICLSSDDFDGHFFQPMLENLLGFHTLSYSLSNVSSFQLPEWILDMIRYYRAETCYSKLLRVWTDLSIQMVAFQTTKKNRNKEDTLSFLKFIYPEVYRKCKRLDLCAYYPFTSLKIRNQYSTDHWIYPIFPFILRFLLCFILDPSLPLFYDKLKENTLDKKEWMTCIYLLLDQEISNTVEFLSLFFLKHSFPKTFSNYSQLCQYMLGQRNERLI